MYTLGIWGFSAGQPEVTWHDTGAAVVRDGEVVAAVNEERMCRIKVDTPFPLGAIDECLGLAGIDFDAIDQVAMVGEPVSAEMRGKMRSCWQEYRQGGHDWRTKISLLGRAYQFWRRSKPWLSPKHHPDRVPPQPVEDKPLHWIPHHHSHAATAWFCSPFEEAVVLTLDGSDSAGGAGLVGHAVTGRRIEFFDSVLETNSLALLYGRFTELLGFKSLRHEGKVLGLAAFADPARLRPMFDARGFWNEKTGWWHIPGFTADISRKRATGLREAFGGKGREEIAAALQDFVEEMVCRKIRRIYRDRPDLKGLPLVVAGGLFANVKLNQRILALPEVSNLYVHPNMGDAGLATGAALYADAETRRDWRPHFLKTVYLGTDIGLGEAQQAIESSGLAVKSLSAEQLVDTIASVLADGKVIARAQGRMEYGPRALGNRSILAKADDPSINDWLNQRLERSEFMPFAPMVLAEHAREYFPDYREEDIAARFMTITYNASERAKKELPAAIHVDGTARPQVVYREDNPEMHAILSAYHEKTGVPALINTSFNMHEEPIVRTAEEAIRAARAARLEGLLLGGVWIPADRLWPNGESEDRATPVQGVHEVSTVS